MFRRLALVAAVMFLGASLFAPAARAAEIVGNPVVLADAMMTSLTPPVLLAEASQFPLQLSRSRPVVKPSVKIDSHAAAKFGMGAVYASTALMHILDVDSTMKAINRGAVEANPLMSGVVNNRIAFFATKAAIAAGSIYATSRIARHNKVGAIITSVALNSAYAMVVRNNYMNAR